MLTNSVNSTAFCRTSVADTPNLRARGHIARLTRTGISPTKIFDHLFYLEVKVYWYPNGRKSHPTRPLYEFKYEPSQLPPLGSFCPHFKKGPGTYLDSEFRAEIKGQFFDLPMEDLEEGLYKSISLERNRRIGEIISKEAGI
jgi:hypothetical protein